jgi:hypothetical protein
VRIRIHNAALARHARTVLPPRATNEVSVSLPEGATLNPFQIIGALTDPVLGKGLAVVTESGTVEVVWDDLPPEPVTWKWEPLPLKVHGGSDGEVLERFENQNGKFKVVRSGSGISVLSDDLPPNAGGC